MIFDNFNLQTCYWAGFIAADGNIYDRDSRIRLHLGEKDKIQLIEFKKFCKHDNVIGSYRNKKIMYCHMNMQSIRQKNKNF